MNLIDSCFVVLITYYNSFKETNLRRDRQGTGVLGEGKNRRVREGRVPYFANKNRRKERTKRIYLTNTFITK